jgi:hypothetical protein
MLADVEVEHEVGECALEACSLAEVNDEAGAGDLCRAVEVEDAESFAQFPVGLRSEGEGGLIAPDFFFAIAVLVLADGNAVLGEVRKRLHHFAQTFVQGHGYGFERLHLGLQGACLLGLGGCVGAFAAQRCDLFGELVALGLQGFELRDGVAAFAVHGAEVAKCGSRVHATGAQFFFYKGEVRPDKCQIDH